MTAKFSRAPRSTRTTDTIAMDAASEDTYTIGEVARMFDLTTRTIRFYEELRLIKPRRIGARRIYGRGDCVRLKLIIRGRRLNFSFDEIREVLDLYRSIGAGKALQIQRLMEILREKREALDAQEEEIRVMRGEIANVEKLCREALRKKNGAKNGKANGKASAAGKATRKPRGH